jgi:hypothetical protein
MHTLILNKTYSKVYRETMSNVLRLSHNAPPKPSGVGPSVNNVNIGPYAYIAPYGPQHWSLRSLGATGGRLCPTVSTTRHTITNIHWKK